MPSPESGLEITSELATTLKANNFTHVRAGYNDEVKIKEFEVLIITGNPEFVTTEGLGPCLGMMLVSKQPQVILGLHYPDPIINDPEIVGKFLDLIDLLKINPSKAEIAVAGVSSESRDLKVTRDFRASLLQAIEAKGFSKKQVQSAWSDFEKSCTINYDRDRRKLEIDQSNDREEY